MAMIVCSECGREISDKANVCVHCGAPMEIANTSEDEIDEINNVEFNIDELLRQHGNNAAAFSMAVIRITRCSILAANKATKEIFERRGIIAMGFFEQQRDSSLCCPRCGGRQVSFESEQVAAKTKTKHPGGFGVQDAR